jgi:hypothetical protein
VTPPMPSFVTPNASDPALKKCNATIEHLKIFNTYYLNKMQDFKNDNTIDFQNATFLDFFDADAVWVL